MARFDTQVVNETWTLDIDQAGRKIRSKIIEERLTKVFESGLCNDDGLFPIRSRYLLNWAITFVKDGAKLSEVVLEPLWVTKKQFKVLLKKSGKHWAKGGLEHLIQLIAKLFDKLGDKLVDMAEDTIVASIMEVAVNQINSDILTDDNIRGLLGMFLK